MPDLKYRSLAEPSMEAATPSSVPEPYYPSIHLDANQFPELFAFGVSDGLELCFKCKIRSKSESEDSKSMSIELRAGAIYGMTEGEYGEKEKDAPAAIIVMNSASEALDGLLKTKPRRI